MRALRGLVKIQALVRGHLVRKRMAAVLRSIGAVMAIQVRARVQRVKMADETRKTSRESALDYQRRNGFRVSSPVYSHKIMLHARFTEISAHIDIKMAQ